MTKVKICGITNITEIDFLNQYLPDYIGFVFAASKRRVTAEKAADLAAGLSPAIRKVGVFVDMEPEKVAAISALVGLDALQLHGSEDASYIAALRRILKPGTEIWKAVRMGGGINPGRSSEPDGGNRLDSGSGPVSGNTAGGDLHLNGALLPDLQSDRPGHEYENTVSRFANRLILDTYTADRSGGTGKTFDWGLARQLRKRTQLPFVLAGGLHPGNVRRAIKQVSPFAVDTSSGVECDGMKDEVKVRNFIEAVREGSR